VLAAKSLFGRVHKAPDNQHAPIASSINVTKRVWTKSGLKPFHTSFPARDEKVVLDVMWDPADTREEDDRNSPGTKSTYGTREFASGKNRKNRFTLDSFSIRQPDTLMTRFIRGKMTTNNGGEHA
jgi:hypothetical protein